MEDSDERKQTREAGERTGTDESKPKQKPKIEKVRDWLNGAGYPLEMRVTRTFKRDMGFSRVVQGDVYKSTGGQLREIDLAAELGFILHRPGMLDRGRRDLSAFFGLLVLCECKSNPKGHRPWLVFTDPTEEINAEFRIQSHFASPLAAELLDELSAREEIQELDLFKMPTVVGYAARCARLGDTGPPPRENDQDPSYEAVMSVLTAAESHNEGESLVYDVFRIALPLIVIDTELYECWLDKNGEVALAQRDEMALAWKQPGVGVTQHSIIYIVTESKLPTFVQRVSLAANALSRDETLIAEIVQAHGSKLVTTPDPAAEWTPMDAPDEEAE